MSDFNSAEYWEQRYQSGDSSGAGSYGRLAKFKADFVNDFVAKSDIKTVLELGCGDGAQLLLSQYPSYVGVDVSQTVVAHCRDFFSSAPQLRFYQLDEPDWRAKTYDLTLSMDVIFHLIEDDVFTRYMENLFDHAGRYVVIYSTDVSWDSPSPHLHHRHFSKWITANRPTWELVQTEVNAYPLDQGTAENSSACYFYVFENRMGNAPRLPTQSRQ